MKKLLLECVACAGRPKVQPPKFSDTGQAYSDDSVADSAKQSAGKRVYYYHRVDSTLKRLWHAKPQWVVELNDQQFRPATDIRLDEYRFRVELLGLESDEPCTGGGHASLSR